MRSKTIFCYALVGIIVTAAWQWQRTRSKSQHLGNGVSVVGQTNAPAKATVSASAAKSSQVIQILAKPGEIPSLPTLAKLGPADEAVLLSEYQRKTNMADRIALVWSLAYIGGDASLAAFRHTLTDEFAGRRLEGGRAGEKTKKRIGWRNLSWRSGCWRKRMTKPLTS